MLISYYTVAGLATIYYLALLFLRLLKKDRLQDVRLIRALTNMMEPFRKTVNKFLLSDLIFTVGMLGAALWRFHSVSNHPTTPYRIFDQLASFFMSCFSVLSCLILQTVAEPKKKESRVRHLYRWKLVLPWIAIAPMTLALFIFHHRDYPRVVGDPSSNSINGLDRNAELSELVWVNKCDPWETRKDLEILLYAGLTMLFINAVWFSLALAYKVSRWWRGKRQSSTDARKTKRSVTPRVKDAWHFGCRALRLLDGLGCAVLMWAFLVLFHLYRDRSHNMAGSSDGGSKQWSFGQILALAAWAPTVIELCNRICPPAVVGMYHGRSCKKHFL
jgi:hypothetical protein